MIANGALVTPLPRALGPLGVCLAGLFVPAPTIQPRSGEVLPVRDRQPGRSHP